MRRVLMALLLVVCGSAWAADFEDGMAAYNRGDYSTAMLFLRRAAERGEVQANFNLGVMYDKGQGVAQDYQEAARWFLAAGKQGYAPSQFYLGVMYANGKGVAQDYPEAVRWYRAAAKQGLAQAQSNLGIMYGVGEGVPEDFVKAHMWANIAGGNGEAKGKEVRDMLASRMTPQQISEAQRMASECMAKKYQGCD